MGRYRMLEVAARRFPEREFARVDGRPWSYAKAHEVTLDVAAGLASLGRPRVAILASNHPMYMVSFYAVSRSGAVAMALSNKNRLPANVELCSRVEPEVLIISEDERDNAKELAAEVGSISTIVAFDSFGADGRSEIEEWAQSQGGELPEPPDPSHIEGLSPTGGTTGASKLARNSCRSLDVMVANVWAMLPLQSYHPTHLVVSPLSHAAGAFAVIVTPAGARHIVHQSFDAEAIITTLVEEEVTDLYLPPTAIYNLLAHPGVRDHSYPALRHLYYAGAPMSVDKMREGMEVFGPVLTQFYGQSEAPLTAVCLTPDDHVRAVTDTPNRLWSCGRPTMFTDVAVLDDAGERVATGERGEVAFRGDLVMAGYLGDETRQTQDWHRSGDVGYLDDDGYLYLIDRKRDVIVSGGFNVFPIEVEQVLWGHPAVEDCAVIGTPHEKWGEQVTAVVQLKPGMQATEAELIQVCRDAVGPIKAPKKVDFVDTLPRSPVGKVLKRDLRDTYWEGRQRKV